MGVISGAVIIAVGVPAADQSHLFMSGELPLTSEWSLILRAAKKRLEPAGIYHDGRITSPLFPEIKSAKSGSKTTPVKVLLDVLV